MINYKEKFNILTPLSAIFKDSDKGLRKVQEELYNNQVRTVRDLVRLKDQDLFVLSSIDTWQLTEIRNFLKMHDMEFDMDFNIMEQLVENANIDKIGVQAAKRRENELREAGNTYAEDIAQEELQSGTLVLNDEEITKWHSLGFDFIDEEIALRKYWEEKLSNIKSIANYQAVEMREDRKFSIRNIKRYILHKFGIITTKGK